MLLIYCLNLSFVINYTSDIYPVLAVGEDEGPMATPTVASSEDPAVGESARSSSTAHGLLYHLASRAGKKEFTREVLRLESCLLRHRFAHRRAVREVLCKTSAQYDISGESCGWRSDQAANLTLKQIMHRSRWPR